MDVLHMICTDCGMKWFFDAFHRAQPEIDVTTCGNCGARLRPTPDEQPPNHPL